MGAIKYDQAFIKSPEGKNLYGKWHNMERKGRCPEWDDFNVFCEWALANGFDGYALLIRHDAKEAFSPGNCYFATNERVDPEWCALWNKTVNRIREHYGMEPLGE